MPEKKLDEGEIRERVAGTISSYLLGRNYHDLAEDEQNYLNDCATQILSDVSDFYRQEGRRGVVEWVNSNSEVEHCDRDTTAYFLDYRWVDENDWQSQQSKWFPEKKSEEKKEKRR